MRWFFLVGGIGFMLAALYIRERPGEAADSIALTFGLLGFFWAVPQVAIIVVQKWRA